MKTVASSDAGQIDWSCRLYMLTWAVTTPVEFQIQARLPLTVANTRLFTSSRAPLRPNELENSFNFEIQ